MSPKSAVQSPKSKSKDKRIKAKITVLIFSIIFVLACMKTQSSQNDFVIADSKSYEASLFRQNCAICHGAEAFGKEVDGKLIPPLRYGDAAAKTETEIYNQIKFGKLPMPAFKNQLTETEIRGMVKFVMEDLQGRRAKKAENVR